MNQLVQKIQRSLESLNYANSHILIGVSGGADSIALLHALATLPKSSSFIVHHSSFSLSVAHLNHGIRAEAADDARFVEDVCRKSRIPFYTATADIPGISAATGTSLEMAARDARYKFFADTAADIGAAAVATAHTQDDQAETLLLKLCRGAGSAGLDGIAAKTEINGLMVIRPMLSVSRAEVENFLNENRISRVEDATNADKKFKRNRIRHDILPRLKQHLNPRIKEALARTAAIMSEDNIFMEQQAEMALESAINNTSRDLAVKALQNAPAAIRRRMLRQWLISNGITSQQMRFDVIEHIVQIITAAKGSGAVTISAESEVRREYDILRFTKRLPLMPGIPETELKVPGTTHIKSQGLLITTTLQTGFERKATGPIGKIPADAIIRWNPNNSQPITVRSWQAGDRIRPLGMQGSCKLQDLFADAKIPREKRHNIPVFLAENEIIWIPGYRISAGSAVADSSEPSLKIRVSRR